MKIGFERQELLEALQKQIAAKLGYRLVDHRLELCGVRLGREG